MSILITGSQSGIQASLQCSSVGLKFKTKLNVPIFYKTKQNQEREKKNFHLEDGDKFELQISLKKASTNY